MRLTSFPTSVVSPSPARRGALTAAALILLFAVVMLLPAGAGAHAFLDRSDPDANAVLPEAPESVRLWFTEPLEVQYSRADLFDSSGERVDTDESFVDPDDNFLMTLPLPDDLPNGTYSVQWRNVSAADGHPDQGYLPFTIGTQQDVVVPTPPALVDFGGPRAEVEAIGRWVTLIGLSGITGAIIVWFWIVQPAIFRLDEARQRRVATRMRQFALASVVVAIIGSIYALGTQVSIVGSPFSIPDITSVLTDTRFGTLWLVRVALLLVLGVFFYLPYGWREDEIPARWVGIGLAGLAMLPLALNSHAAAPGEGRAAAIVADWVHLAASSAWIGGLMAMLIGVVYATRGTDPDVRRPMLAEIIPRFSTMAISAVIILGLTGFYASWLQVGNLIALQETSHGQTLVIKVALMFGMLVIGAVNLLWIGPQMRESVRSGLHFRRTMLIEVGLGIAVLFMVGLLTSLPTARDTLNAQAGRTTFHITQDRLHVSLYLTPGAVGSNRYTADFSPGDFPDGTQAFLRVTPQSDLTGVREVELFETDPGRFETTGSELSAVGDWDLEVILRRPNEADWRVTTETNIQNVPPEARAPSPAPRLLRFDGAVWVLVISAAIGTTVWGFRRPAGRGLGWFGVALIGLSVAGIAFNHEMPVPGADERNPIMASEESIARGGELFNQNCTECHGPLGQGDGPTLANVDSWRADLTAPHLWDHTEGELHWWIAYGIGGTLMPGFGDQISDEDIWHLVNYVYHLNESRSAR